MIDLVLKDINFELTKNLNFSRIIRVNLIKANSIKELRKKVDIEKGLVIVDVNSEEICKAALLNKKVDVIINQEKVFKRDHLHYRQSGLNQVFLNLAKKNNIAIGFSFNEILKNKNRPLLLGRMIQNIKLCRKYKVKFMLASFAPGDYGMRNALDLVSFLKCLGATDLESKKALNLNI